MLTESRFGEVQALESAKAEAWAREQAAYDQALRLLKESPERVFGADQLQAAFRIRPTAIVCLDEGVSLGDPSATEIGIAGSGIFMSDDELAQVAAAIRVAGLNIQTVTYHDNCGAAGLYAADHGLNPTEAARKAATRMIRALKLAGEPVRIGLNDAPIALQRDPRFHHNRAVIVDGTGRLNAPVFGLPAALQLSARFYPTPHRLREEVVLAETIAMDEQHGFGSRFTPEQPLLLILVGDETDPDWRLSSLEEVLESVLTRADHRSLVIPVPITRLPVAA